MTSCGVGNMATRSLQGFLFLFVHVIAVLFLSLPSTASRLRRLQTIHTHCKLPSSRGPTYDCFDEKCRCTDNIANCSHNHGSLLFVPRLPPGIQLLDMSYNNLTTIPHDFFTNVTNITSLVLSNNELVHVSHGAFGALKHLQILVMQDNKHLTETTIEPVFEGHTLKCVDLCHGLLRGLPDNLYSTLTLENLFLCFNLHGDLNLSRFEVMPKLRLLDLTSNHMQNFVPGHVRNLEILLLGLNRLSLFPDMCSTTDSATFLPRLVSLDLRYNHISGLPHRLCLPVLSSLELDGNLIEFMKSNMFHFTRFPNLNYLHLQNEKSGHMHSIQNYSFNNSHLQRIKLNYNGLDFSDQDVVQSDSFVGCSNLTSLDIGNNHLYHLTDERFLRLFGHLTRLQSLSLSGTSFHKITTRTFSRFPHLQTLILHINSVAEIPDGAFAANLLLADLDLNTNRITTIRPTTFTQENRMRLKRLSLGGNPFVCDCELRWFSEWLVRNMSIFSHTYGPYDCSNRPMKVASFSMPDQACMLSRRQSQMILVIVSVVLLIAIPFSYVFRYRWHIRLLLYEAFRGNEDARRRRLEAGRFDYDVFVSYAAEDTEWVQDILMPELEGRLGLRLCVHERDFIPGKNIVDNIADCVNQSKKILMVFSRNFVCSQWCQFELSYCLRHVIENDDALLVLCLGDVVSRHLTSAMMAVLKITVYIQWVDDDDDAIASFWGRLRIALREVGPLEQH